MPLQASAPRVLTRKFTKKKITKKTRSYHLRLASFFALLFARKAFLLSSCAITVSQRVHLFYFLLATILFRLCCIWLIDQSINHFYSSCVCVCAFILSVLVKIKWINSLLVSNATADNRKYSESASHRNDASHYRAWCRLLCIWGTRICCDLALCSTASRRLVQPMKLMST